MPDPEQAPCPQKQDLVRRLARPAVDLAGVIVFQLLFASVFAGVLHQAPVVGAGRSPLAQVFSDHGGGTGRLVAEPPASDSAGTSLFLVIAWRLGGYVPLSRWA